MPKREASLMVGIPWELDGWEQILIKIRIKLYQIRTWIQIKFEFKFEQDLIHIQEGIREWATTTIWYGNSSCQNQIGVMNGIGIWVVVRGDKVQTNLDFQLIQTKSNLVRSKKSRELDLIRNLISWIKS